MTGIRKKNKILGLIFAVLAVWMMVFQNPSYAAQRGSLNVKMEQAGMTVHLYRAAEKQNGVYVINEAFQASGVDVAGGGSREAAIALADFVTTQGITAYRTGTGSGKHVVFRNLPDGEALYLVTGDPMKVGERTYIPAPVLVEAGGAAAEVDMKCDIKEPEEPTKPTEPTEPTKPTDPSNPTSPTRHYDDSDDDDWDPTPDKKPRATTAAGETVTITDSAQPETDAPETAGETAAAETEAVSEPASGLPQTGQVWWPVGILLSAGAVLLIAGTVMKRRSKEK